MAKSKVVIVGVGLQILSNVLLCVYHAATLRHRCKQPTVNNLHLGPLLDSISDATVSQLTTASHITESIAANQPKLEE